MIVKPFHKDRIEMAREWRSIRRENPQIAKLLWRAYSSAKRSAVEKYVKSWLDGS